MHRSREKKPEKPRRRSMKEDREENFQWIVTQNLTDYTGLWIAVVDKDIVGKGKDVLRVIENARKKYPKRVPFVYKVPSAEIITL